MLVDQLFYGIQCQVWVNCTRTKTKQCCKMMYLTRLSGFENQEREVRFFVFTRYRCNADTASREGIATWLSSTSSVGKDQDIGSVSVCTVRLNKETITAFSRLVFL